MIHAMGWLVKITLFSILILVLGNWIQWNGKSVSDQVTTQISHAERSNIANSLRRWTGNVAQDMRSGATHKGARHKHEVRSKEVSYQETEEVADASTESSQSASDTTTSSPTSSKEAKPMEKIRSSERQKLRALIQELNTSTSADRRGSR
jgi:hypothetical protein